MENTFEEVKLNTVTNETDPKVVFDCKYEKTVVAMPWNPQDSTEEGANNDNAPKQQTDKIRIDGIKVPIIKVNTQVIPTHDIINFKLYYTSFKPELDLTLRKADYSKLDTPGMVNKITVIMIPPEDGTYRKISLDFYITSVEEYDDMIVYGTEFFFPALETKYNKVIKKDGNNKLSTYEMLEAIASECQLGFAATKQCKDIADNKIRLMRDQNYQDAIHEHIKFSGLDDKSIFDCWIDVYGYLVMSNTAWILEQSVNYNDISMNMVNGVNITDSVDFANNNVKYGESTFRSFTNLRGKAKKESNGIQEYKWTIDNQRIKINGTDNTYYVVDHIVNGGKNSITSENIVIEEDTPDGKYSKETYSFPKKKFIGVEMCGMQDGNTPVLYQEKRRDAFFTKLKTRVLELDLEDLNLGLERGQLINVFIFEYEVTNKREMISNVANLKDGGDQEVQANTLEDYKDIIEDSDFGIPNLSISGMYLIDGIEYSYGEGMTNIHQKLYLIRKTPARSYLNLSSLPKFKIDNNE